MGNLLALVADGVGFGFRVKIMNFRRSILGPTHSGSSVRIVDRYDIDTITKGWLVVTTRDIAQIKIVLRSTSLQVGRLRCRRRTGQRGFGIWRRDSSTIAGTIAGSHGCLVRKGRGGRFIFHTMIMSAARWLPTVISKPLDGHLLIKPSEESDVTGPILYYACGHVFKSQSSGLGLDPS